jgi:leader peptidase (prepilin peptidase)/N-methyltransferase
MLTFGLFGLIVGSFLNVLILRRGAEGLGGRSHCMSCGALIRWYDNVPVFSWLALQGKCRSCGARISLQYPLVEVLTGILFALIGAATGFALWQQALFCLLAALLVAIAVHDLRTTIIPDPWVYTFVGSAFLLGVVGTALNTPSLFLSSLLGGPIAALPLFLLWLLSRGAWMGFGDVKLALGMGWLLGPVYGTAAVFFAFVIGAVVSVCILLPLPAILSALGRVGITRVPISSGGFTMRSEIPFGPFLVASTFIIWLLLINSVDPLALVGLSL